MARIDGNLNVTAEEPVRQDRTYSSSDVIAVLDSSISGGGGGGGDGGGGTTNRTKQTATYQTHTNPLKVYYTALATDGVTPLVDRTQAGVTLIASNYQLYGYDQPLDDGLTDWIAVWDEGDPNNYTISWEVVGGGTGLVGPPPPPQGDAIALFTATQSQSSLLTLDATTSTADTYAWTLDGSPRPETSAVITYGPLVVGPHTVTLTVTALSDGSTSILTKTIQVAWIAEPIWAAQRDNTNGLPGVGVDLEPWVDPEITLLGPWRTRSILNGPGANGDGYDRAVVPGDGTVKLTTRTADVGTGYRTSVGMNSAYNAAQAGYPAPGAGYGAIDVCGNIAIGGTTGHVRFYRAEYLLCGTNSDATHPPGYPTALYGMNNVSEIKGNFGGIGIVALTPDYSGFGSQATNLRCDFFSLPGGITNPPPTASFDTHQLQYDVWQNYVIELLLSTDSSVGYVRVYRDGVVVSTGDGAGRYFAQTQQTDSANGLVEVAWNLEVYRNKAAIDVELGLGHTVNDVTVQYRNYRVGPTLASVMAL